MTLKYAKPIFTITNNDTTILMHDRITNFTGFCDSNAEAPVV